ncbi:MAG: hypothetical protein A2V90_00110 [Gammaproteobacteria bacterium RBG_16_57_12]|nr:MAG: hypothetical protein A2V90_00110 [Gammaproteobacteria bacterium RBG_16_57_12]
MIYDHIQMIDKLPKFDNPPVIETILSAQFEHLDIFSNAHAGWFWKNYLDNQWIQVQEVPRIDDQFERFGNERGWILNRGLRIAHAPQSERTQIIRSDWQRMIQVQDSRFIYNWRKGASNYPSYDEILPEYQELLDKFEGFVINAGNKKLRFNQWEVSYVNHLPKGELWESPKDWDKILINLMAPAATVVGSNLDGFNGEWSLAIGDNKGRLYIAIKHARVGAADGDEIMVIQLTARGPVEDDRLGLINGFNLGREMIVRSFADMTSDDAHRFWKRRT